jgi:hypothetical protein
VTVARFAVAVCAAVLLHAAPAAAADAGEAVVEKALSTGPVREVEVRDALLSVELLDAPLTDVIDRIARAGGFAVEYASRDAVRGSVSTRFSGVPIERGLKRIFALADVDNYFIHYGDRGEITRLEILGEGVKQPERIEGGGGRGSSARPSARRTAPVAGSVRPPAPFEPLVNPPLPGEPEPAGDAPALPDVAPEAPFVAPSGGPTYISPSQRN